MKGKWWEKETETGNILIIYILKRNERRINQQSDGDDDENTSYEY